MAARKSVMHVNQKGTIQHRLFASATRSSNRLKGMLRKKIQNEPVEVIDMTLADSDDETELPVVNESMRKHVTGSKSVKENTNCSGKGKGKIGQHEADDDFAPPIVDEHTNRSTAGHRKGSKSVRNENKSNLVIRKEPNKLSIQNVVRMRPRSPPISLYKFIKSLTDDQKKSIRDLGFESVLDFNIRRIPSHLGLIVLQKFDPESCTLNVNGRLVHITRKEIFDVIGIPMGDIALSALQACNKYDEVTSEWRAQFPDNMKRIYSPIVIEMMKKQRSGGRLFKQNFLVLFVTVMIEGVTNGTVNQRFLPCLSNLDVSKNMDWCGYVLEALKRSKAGWDRKSHYSGPLTMIVVLYANTLAPNRVSRNVNAPMINVWTTKMLSEIEDREVASTMNVARGDTTEVVNDTEEDDNNIIGS